MDKQEILDIFEEIGICSELEILEVVKGNNVEDYILQTPLEKYILRKSRTDTHGNRLKHESIVLKFLEKKELDFLPKSIHYDEEKDIHIIDFLEGEYIRVDQLNKKQLEDLATKISNLSNINCEEFKEFCQECEHETDKFESSLNILQEYTIKPFEYIQENCDDKKLVDYLREHVKENMHLFQNTEEDLFFSHGDISSNLLVYGDKIKIIGWELANTLLSKGNELGHIMRTFDLEPDLKETLLRNYIKDSKHNIKELNEKIIFDIKTYMVNDILRTAKKFVEMKKKNIDGWEKYYDLTQEKIRLYKEKMKEFG